MQSNQIPKIPATPKRATASTPRKPATKGGRIMVAVVDRNGKRALYQVSRLAAVPTVIQP